MATELDVLERLEALLSQATPGYKGMGQHGIRVRSVRRPWGFEFEASGSFDGMPKQIADFDTEEDADAYAALRNAAPALIRLARAALAMYGSAESGDATEAEVAVIGKQIEDGMKALGEVRL